ncbi:MAG: 50S ribosomal protein L18 [Parcubacteria group bacterium CG11_big_fil_rev_8_21_14_0_20_39_22]|nr:MAG: 50S ribosomal protein L18 [Parcubacteria group bacterium CG11_big_fil_rev_8_21_14_0_20_39_22]
MKVTSRQQKRETRRARIRTKISGSADKPRLSVFKSSKFIYAQLIDDRSGTTMAAASSRGLSGSQIERSAEVGKKIAEDAKAKGISKVVFDRGGYRYTGNIKSLADGARNAGLSM